MDIKHTYCVIMAGGVGTRFWPLSRRQKPKQFLDILGTGKTLLRMTYERFLEFIPKENFIIVTNENYRNLVHEQLPEVDDTCVLGEPIGRNTAPCLCYAAEYLLQRDPEAVMIATPSDHVVTGESLFRETIQRAVDFATSHDALMTIAINPTRPETGYGYIQISNRDEISKAKSFTEKPSLELAQTFVQCGEYFWNSGIFVWRVDSLLSAVEKSLPEYYSLFEGLDKVIGTPEEKMLLRDIYSQCRPISIDYGVMEKASNVYVIRGAFSWSDIGTWGSFYMNQRKDKFANVKPEDCYVNDTKGCIVSLPGDKIAVISGLKDYIVADTEDVLLICPKSEELSLKKYIDEVKYKKGEKYI